MEELGQVSRANLSHCSQDWMCEREKASRRFHSWLSSLQAVLAGSPDIMGPRKAALSYLTDSLIPKLLHATGLGVAYHTASSQPPRRPPLLSGPDGRPPGLSREQWAGPQLRQVAWGIQPWVSWTLWRHF